LKKFPEITSNQPSVLDALEKYCNDLTVLWTDISCHDDVIHSEQSVLIRQLRQFMTTSTMIDPPDRLPWRTFLQILDADPVWTAIQTQDILIHRAVL
jgi:hypothetical protein